MKTQTKTKTVAVKIMTLPFLADEYHALTDSEEKLTKKLAALKEKKDALKEDITTFLKSQGMDSARHGDFHYTLEYKPTSFEIVPEKADLALAWALEKGIARVDKVEANKILRRDCRTEFDLPPAGFVRKADEKVLHVKAFKGKK